MIYSQVALILIGSFWAPWWWVAIVGLVYGWRFNLAGTYGASKIVYASFVSAFMVWAIFAYYFDLRGGGAVGEWLSELLHLKSRVFVYLLTGGLGGMVAASSSYIGTKIQKKPSDII